MKEVMDELQGLKELKKDTMYLLEMNPNLSPDGVQNLSQICREHARVNGNLFLFMKKGAIDRVHKLSLEDLKGFKKTIEEAIQMKEERTDLNDT